VTDQGSNNAADRAADSSARGLSTTVRARWMNASDKNSASMATTETTSAAPTTPRAPSRARGRAAAAGSALSPRDGAAVAACAAASEREKMPTAVSPGISQIQSTVLCPISTAPAAAAAAAGRRSSALRPGQPPRITAATPPR
jgi:hypothetical protein